MLRLFCRFLLAVACMLAISCRESSKVESELTERREQPPGMNVESVSFKSKGDKVGGDGVAGVDGFSGELLAMCQLSEEELKKHVYSEYFRESVKKMKPIEVMEVLSREEMKGNSFLLSQFIDVLGRVKEGEFIKDEEWVRLLSEEKYRGRFSGVASLKLLLVKHSEWFSPEHIARALELGNLKDDEDVSMTLQNRLNLDRCYGGEGGYTASVVMYLAALPDSPVRDQVYAGGYISTLEEEELLSLYDEILYPEMKEMSRTDSTYAYKLIEVGRTDLAKTFYQELINQGQMSRASIAAQVIASKSEQDLSDLFDWTKQLPSELEGKNQAIISAFSRLAQTDLKKAQNLYDEEKDTNLRVSFKINLDINEKKNGEQGR